VLAAREGAWVALLFALPLLAGVLYASPLLPAGARFRRIKDVTGLKSIYVAGTWAATAGLLPLVVSGVPIAGSRAALLACLWVLARFFINTVFFDIGDVEGDRESGTMTLPVVFGVERTRRALIILNGATALLVVVGVELLGLSPVAYVFNLLPLYGGVYLGLAKDRRELGFLCDVVVDGEGAVAGLLSLLVCGGLMLSQLSSLSS
jgi:4-hydroxybenzoate polyprenyltransferase